MTQRTQKNKNAQRTSVQLPAALVETYFFQFAGYAKKNDSGILTGGCPVCREGSSWGKKRRLYYIPDRNIICCHNCNSVWSPLKWINIMTGASSNDILCEMGMYEYCTTIPIEEKKVKRQGADEELPYNSINLNSKQQLKYYSTEPVVIDALRFITNRRLDTAYNSIDYYISLDDFTHRRRLIIPFKNTDGKTVFYQTRALYKQEEFDVKYLSKVDTDKSVFGLDKLDTSIDYMFITEGPLDACFIRNGLSIAGLSYTKTQEEQLNDFFGMKRIWVLDNDFRTNPDVRKKYEKLIERGENVFIWSKDCPYKDINEMCVTEKLDRVPDDYFLSRTFKGIKAEMELKL